MAGTICAEERVGCHAGLVRDKDLWCCQRRPAPLTGGRHRGTGCVFDHVLIQPREVAPEMLARTVALIPQVRKAGDGLQGKKSARKLKAVRDMRCGGNCQPSTNSTESFFALAGLVTSPTRTAVATLCTVTFGFGPSQRS